MSLTVPWLTFICQAATVMVPLMVLCWVVSERIRNAGIVDVLWAISFGIMATYFALLLNPAPERRYLLLAAILPWSLRLAAHLATRFRKEYPREDGRYFAMRQSWGARASFNMFWVFQLQCWLIVFLSLPFALFAADPAASIKPVEIAGAVVCLIGLAGEWVADEQLRKFKQDPNNKGRVCAAGLWYWSRHPNYFFEWIVWIGIYVMCCTSPGGVFALYAPLVMLYFLTKVTGVKITEEHAAKSRGEEYRLYQESTSSFLPWFKKKVH